MHFLAFVLQEGFDEAAARHMVLELLALLPLFIAVGLAIVIVPYWFICKKAGFSPWLSLLNAVPLGNLVLIYVLAFAGWKVMPVPQPYGQPYPPYPPYPPQPPAPPQG